MYLHWFNIFTSITHIPLNLHHTIFTYPSTLNLNPQSTSTSKLHHLIYIPKLILFNQNFNLNLHSTSNSKFNPPQYSSPSAPNAPTKTSSTNETSTSFIPSTSSNGPFEEHAQSKDNNHHTTKSVITTKSVTTTFLEHHSFAST